MNIMERTDRNLKMSATASRFMIAFTIGFFIISLNSTQATAGKVECSTLCKAGPKDYSDWSRWTCFYITRSSSLSTHRQEIESSECFLRIEGRYVDSAPRGSYEDLNDCLEKFCIPTIEEICGDEDRCIKTKNWK